MLNDASLLITGGTGSFGNYFTDYVLAHYKPKKIVIYSRDEYKQFQMRNRLQKHDRVMRYFVGDVRDESRLYRAFNGIDYVIHAAAMKQVPACEYNPLEAIKTNINGATNVIDAALDAGVSRVVALSTDKAVNPINLYGGTKLVSDKLFIAANAYSGGGPLKTCFSIVRYGNVAGSRGSVVPFFHSLLENGTTNIPITHPDMTRFWITLEQGVQLVLKALLESRGGETYISKIPSFRVVDLAGAMAPNLPIHTIGIREGEKLHEVMVTSDDASHTLEYPDHYIIYPQFDWSLPENRHPGGQPVPEGFVYSSGTNERFLSVEEISQAITQLYKEG